MRSSSIIDIISTARNFRTTPADIVGIDESDVYSRFCFNDACNYIYNRMHPDDKGKQELPNFEQFEEHSQNYNPGLDFLMN